MQDALKFLETKRLILRPFEEADFSTAYRIASDPATTRYLFFWGRIGSTPQTDAERFMEYALGAWKSDPMRAWEYCVVRKDTGEAIGEGSLEWLDEGNQEITAELGWILLPGHRGQGFATEMGRELCRAGFEVLGAQKIIAHCDDQNTPSWRVMERLGMRFAQLEKGVRPEKRAGDPKGDERTYLITRNEWLAAQNKESTDN